MLYKYSAIVIYIFFARRVQLFGNPMATPLVKIQPYKPIQPLPVTGKLQFSVGVEVHNVETP